MPDTFNKDIELELARRKGEAPANPDDNRYGNLFEEYSTPRQRAAAAPKNLFEEDAKPAAGQQPASLFGTPVAQPKQRIQTPAPRTNLFDEPTAEPRQRVQPSSQNASLFHTPQPGRPAVDTEKTIIRPAQKPASAPQQRPVQGSQPSSQKATSVQAAQGNPATRHQNAQTQVRPVQKPVSSAPVAQQPTASPAGHTIVSPAHTRAPGQGMQPKTPQSSLFEEDTQRPYSAQAGQTTIAPAMQAHAQAGATRVQPAHASKPANAQNVYNNSGQNGAAANHNDSGSTGGGSGNRRGKKGGNSGGGKKVGAKVGKKVFGNIVKAVFTIGCIGVVIVSMVAVWAANYVVESTKNDDLLLDLNNMALSQTGYMLARNPDTGEWVEYQKITGDSNSIWTPLSEMSEYAIQALLSTEDKQFYDHNGFSITRTAGAALNQVFHFNSRAGGGSTIDQQLVKNLTGDNVVYDNETGDMTAGYLRKLREIFRAIGLNNNYSKDQILEAYLNTMPLSGTIVGVGAGAREYFNKTPQELTLWEAAMIVGITNSPYYYNPYVNPDNCLKRRNDVIYFMYQDGKISDAEYQNAINQPLGLYTGQREQTETTTSTVSSWFADAVYRQVVSDLVSKGVVNNANEAQTYYFNQGLRIETTVDLSIQAAMEEMFLDPFAEGGPFPADLYTYAQDADGNTTDEIVYPQAAMVVMDYDGNVLGIIGGIGEKEGNLVLNRATQSPRPVGSTMKMVAAYALGIEYNVINWSSMLQDSPSLTADGKTPSDLAEATWPRNYRGAGSGGFITVQSAVAESLNTIAVRVGLALGTQEMYEFAVETLGITTLEPEEAYYPSSMVLGGQEKGISALELTAAYAMYGNGGIYTVPRFYERVLDADGNVIMVADNYSYRAISEETAYIGNRLMRTVFTASNGTALNMQPERMDAVAKTGTTNEDRDRWFVGLTPYYVSSLWLGYDDNYTITAGTVSRNPNTIAWRQLMNTLQADLEDRSFPAQPAGIVERQYCTETGLLASESCGSTATGYYKSTDDALPMTCQGH